MNDWRLGIGSTLLLLLSGCGAYPETSTVGDSDTPDDVMPAQPSTTGSEHVEQVAQAVNETSYDLPAAGSIIRYDSTAFDNFELWVFACNAANNKMMRRTRSVVGHDKDGQQVFEWGSWHTVNTSVTCAGAPAVGSFPGGTPRDNLLVYWRDLNNRLIEADYASDGSATITDMSDYLGIGPIAGTPAIADVRNDPGLANRISVAVIMADTNELYTLDHYSSSWHVRPILLTGGGTATGMGTVFSTSYGPREFGYSQSYIAMQLNLGAHMIYTRSSWAQSYTQFAWQTNHPPGVVSIGGHPRYCQDGCALSRDAATSRPMWAPLSNGGDITALLKPMNPTPLAHEVTLGGSMFATPQPISMGAACFARASNGHLAEVTGPFGGTYDDGGSDLRSAPVPADSGALYAAGPSRRLYYNSPHGIPFIEDLGLNVRAP